MVFDLRRSLGSLLAPGSCPGASSATVAHTPPPRKARGMPALSLVAPAISIPAGQLESHHRKRRALMRSADTAWRISARRWILKEPRAGEP